VDGAYVYINSFLSTTLDQAYSTFLIAGAQSGDTEPVVFEIDADPRVVNLDGFADISSHSDFPDEKEVLFMAGSMFSVVNIREENGITIISMVLCRSEPIRFELKQNYLC